MPAFEYIALKPNGKRDKGVLEGDSARQIRQLLRERQLMPMEVTEVAGKNTQNATSSGFGNRISTTDMALIMRQLATLVRSGLPLEESLLAVAEQNEKAKQKNMLMAIRSKVLGGHTLAHGLRDFPQAFPELFLATIDAGEQSGHLDIVLERLADYAEARQQLKQKSSLALLYPAILTIVAVTVVVMLMTFVVPQVISTFDNIGQELPPLTVGLIALSDFLQDYGFFLFIGIILSSVLAGIVFRKEGPKYWLHRQFLRLPLIGRLTRGLNTARFSRTLSILIASSVPVLDALRISAQVVLNRPMRKAISEAADRVREGVSIHKSLAASKLFPPMTLHLIANGEVSGELENMLERAAINQERESETMISGLMGVLEPVMILIMGMIVLVIVIAILLPIFDLNQLIQ